MRFGEVCFGSGGSGADEDVRVFSMLLGGEEKSASIELALEADRSRAMDSQREELGPAHAEARRAPAH